jgi:uncharacterized membrane protein
MRGKVHLLGHSVHPMLIVFPLGLLGVVPIFDIVRYATRNDDFGHVSFWLLSAGLIGAVLAAVPGFLDWRTIPSTTRAHRIGLVHLVVNLCAVALFVLSWILRFPALGRPSAIAFVVSLVGVTLAVVGGWFGGELVERSSAWAWASTRTHTSTPARRSTPGASSRARPSRAPPDGGIVPACAIERWGEAGSGFPRWAWARGPWAARCGAARATRTHARRSSAPSSWASTSSTPRGSTATGTASGWWASCSGGATA